jgi:hypothetical protein
LRVGGRLLRLTRIEHLYAIGDRDVVPDVGGRALVFCVRMSSAR